MDLIISSRLHLIILASIVHVPFIGVSRGSKVDNFLKAYGLESVGNVEQCDFDRLKRETERLLAGGDAFEARSREVRTHLLDRLSKATDRLKEVLS
jgi:polysaccharide pyruvyl transferase WcaK-like protein